MFMDREALIHFIGGAVGGTAGNLFLSGFRNILFMTVLSMDVYHLSTGSSKNEDAVKQRNYTSLDPVLVKEARHRSGTSPPSISRSTTAPKGPMSSTYKHFLGDIEPRHGMSAGLCRRFRRSHKQIVKNEGIGGLYKGLLPNLVGVAPSKAVYFYSYSTSKRMWNDSGFFAPNSAIIHMVSAGTADTGNLLMRRHYQCENIRDPTIWEDK
ncbi:hypothetical protein COOONC_02350 [Cooperia oncophora]